MSYPTSPGFESVDFRSREFNVQDESQTGKSQSRGLGGQIWTFTARYRSLRPEVFAPVLAFVASQGGSRGVFDIQIPTVSKQAGTATGTVTVTGAQAVGDDRIEVQGLAGTLKAGGVVRFDGHSKVYMLTADQTGPGILQIYPPLIESVANLEGVTYDDVPFTVRLESDVQEFGLRNDRRREYELDFKEAL